EGPTSDAEVLALRGQRSRAMLCTLLLSFGVPMLLGGDELGRTQAGNNNAYCQDNEISWVDWSAVDAGLLEFVKGLVAFRRAHPVFRRHRYLTGVEAAELGWFTPAGAHTPGRRPGHGRAPVCPGAARPAGRRLTLPEGAGVRMEIRRKRADTRPGPRDWFTGQVWMDEIATPGPPSRVRMLSVHFA